MHPRVGWHVQNYILSAYPIPQERLQEKGQTMGKPVGTFTTCLHKKG